MKKMMLVAVVAVAGWTIAYASEKVAVLDNVVGVEEIALQDKRTQVESENLPQGIKTALSAEEYSGWTVSTAFHVEPDGRDAYYEISLEKEGEEDLRVIKMDADGKVKDGDITPPTLL